MSGKAIITWIIVLLAAASIVGVVVFAPDKAKAPSDGEVDTSDWQTYSNDAFGFSVLYPSEWQTAEFPDDEIAPKFNFYPETESDQEPPFIHHNDVPQVSVFPEGVPTEGVFGETKDFDVDIGMEVSDDSRIYTLEDGTPFAAFVKPANTPETWGEAGFIWVRINVENADTRCLDANGNELSAEQCDPMVEDHTIVRSGTTDPQDWETAMEVLRNIEFTEAGSSDGGDTQTTYKDLIRIETPQPNGEVSSPLTVTGEARGNWYFEGSFSLVLTDWDGRIIAEAPATAQGEWMTEDYVPFEGELTFESPYQEGDPDYMKRGTLIMQKANPSGRPENDDAFEVTVEFAPTEN